MGTPEHPIKGESEALVERRSSTLSDGHYLAIHLETENRPAGRTVNSRMKHFAEIRELKAQFHAERDKFRGGTKQAGGAFSDVSAAFWFHASCISVAQAQAAIRKLTQSVED
jgi:hypothetical protein